MKNWRALTRHLGRREHMSETAAGSRQAVGVEATAPNTSPWSRRVARSVMVSPPSAIITARSVAIRPGS
jgi:hypothetical protein